MAYNKFYLSSAEKRMDEVSSILDISQPERDALQWRAITQLLHAMRDILDVLDSMDEP